jgi:hypothetical protein
VNTNYLPSFIRDLKALKKTPIYNTFINDEVITFARVQHRRDIYRYFPYLGWNVGRSRFLLIPDFVETSQRQRFRFALG